MCLYQLSEVVQMKLYNSLGLVISLVLTFICYFATSNIFVGVGVLVLSILFYFLLIYKPLSKHKTNTQKIHECYLFINNFLITLSIKGSLNAAFDATRTSISDDYSEFIGSIEEMTPQEKLIYLNKYFPYHIFQIFIDVILLWQEEGGDILDMSSHITNEMREIKEYVTYCQSISRRKALEIGTLWFFSLAIVIALRLTLNDFYSGLLKQPLFVAAVVGLAVLVLFSIYLLVMRVTHIEVRRNYNG